MRDQLTVANQSLQKSLKIAGGIAVFLLLLAMLSIHVAPTAHAAAAASNAPAKSIQSFQHTQSRSQKALEKPLAVGTACNTTGMANFNGYLWIAWVECSTGYIFINYGNAPSLGSAIQLPTSNALLTTGVALMNYAGGLWITWVDTNTVIHVAQIDTTGSLCGKRYCLYEQKALTDYTYHTPGLSLDPTNDEMALAFDGTNTRLYIDEAYNWIDGYTHYNFTNYSTNFGPALADFNSSLYIVYGGTDPAKNIYAGYVNLGSRTINQTKAPGGASNAWSDVGATVIDYTLYFAYQYCQSTDGCLHYVYSPNGTSWTQKQGCTNGGGCHILSGEASAPTLQEYNNAVWTSYPVSGAGQPPFQNIYFGILQ